MALREVQPLDEEQWNMLVDELQKEPTQVQTKYIKEAVETGRKLKVHR